MSRIRTNLITNRMANGAPTVSNGLVIAGVTTVTTLDLNGDLDVDGHTNLDNLSVAGVSTFAGAIDLNADLDVDGHTNLDNVSIAGVCTATSFVGSGANLTNLDASDLASGTVPTARLGSGTASSSTFLAGDSTFKTVTGTTINSNADNRLITGSGTANTLNGESTATYNGTKLFLSGGSGNDGHISMLELKHLNTSTSTGGGTGDGPALLLNGYYSSNEWALAKIAATNAGGSYGSGYGGALQFWVHPANGTQTASVIKAADIIGDGSGANLTITDGNLKIGTSGHGIDFSATSNGNGSNVAELFSDYEEGSWTPQVLDGNGSNYTVSKDANQTVYRRIGDMVFIFYNITRTENGSKTGILYIPNSSLPFSVTHGIGAGGQFWVDHSSPSAGLGDIVGGHHNIGTGGVYWVKPTDKSGIGQASTRYLEHGQWSYGRPIYGSFCYRTS